MCNFLPSSVSLYAWYLASFLLCFSSCRSSKGSLKNTCSVSAWLTPCLSWLFLALPLSQSKPITLLKSVMRSIFSAYTSIVKVLTSCCYRKFTHWRSQIPAEHGVSSSKNPVGRDEKRISTLQNFGQQFT